MCHLVGILRVEDLPHLQVLNLLAWCLETALLLAADRRKVHVVDQLSDLLRIGVIEHLADHTRQEILILKLHFLLSFHGNFAGRRDNNLATISLPHFLSGLRPNEALEVV